MTRSPLKAVIIADAAMLLAFSLGVASRIYIETKRGAFPGRGTVSYLALLLVCLSLVGGIALEARKSRAAVWVNLGIPLVLLLTISASVVHSLATASGRQGTLVPAAVALSAPWLLLLFINGFAYRRR